MRRCILKNFSLGYLHADIRVTMQWDPSKGVSILHLIFHISVAVSHSLGSLVGVNIIWQLAKPGTGCILRHVVAELRANLLEQLLRRITSCMTETAGVSFEFSELPSNLMRRCAKLGTSRRPPARSAATDL